MVLNNEATLDFVSVPGRILSVVTVSQISPLSNDVVSAIGYVSVTETGVSVSRPVEKIVTALMIVKPAIDATTG
jgi:hypothetical protein